MTTDEIIVALRTLNCRVEPCGSRVTCDPPPQDTDADYLVEIVASKNRETIVGKVVDLLGAAEFKWEGNEHYQSAADTFMSWRRAATNFIVTANAEFAERHRLATWLSAKLNLLNKLHRVALFQAVLYGNRWTGKASAPEKPAPVMLSLSDMLLR